MALQRVILEMGTGNDLHGGDYTKAALRAVQDALHHSSLSMLRALKVPPAAMVVEVTIGVQRPERVDLEGGCLVFRTLKKRREGVYRAVPVPLQPVDEPGFGDGSGGMTSRTTSPAVGSINQKRRPPRAASSFGVPAPSSSRSTRPRLKPATCTR